MPRLCNSVRGTRLLRSAAVAILVLAANECRAVDAPTAGVDFEKQVAPLLVQSCLSCHAGDDPAGGLKLTSTAGLTAGGDSGAAVVTGQPAASLLLARVRAGEMPPATGGARLTEPQVAMLEAWITAGAHWPAERRLSPYEFSTERRAGLDWWSLQPVRRPPVPDVGAEWNRNPIDAFIYERLAAAGLSPAPEANRATLLRRVKFDLHGLPPTPAELDEFVTDSRTDAYERLVDRLLASPHYGERWARHWLDVVRFGETDGYETNKPRRTAWPYRDYVIRALNEDRPYRQFVQEQLTGDQTGEDAATGFLVGGTHDIVGIQNIEGQLQQRANDLDDIVSTTTTAFLGLTAGCARCHDHKFDPITHQDYHALKAILAGVKHGERDLLPPDYEQRLKDEPAVRRELAGIQRRLAEFEPLAQSPALAGRTPRSAVHATVNVDRFTPVRAGGLRFVVLASSQSEPCLDEIEVYTAEEAPRNVALASAGARATASGVFSAGSNALHQLSHINDGQIGNAHSWISAEANSGWIEIQFAEPVEITRVVWGRDREGKFADRLPTKYRIDVATAAGQWQTVATDGDRRPYTPGAKPAATTAESLAQAGFTPEQCAEYTELLQARSDCEARLPTAGTQKIYAGTFEQPEATHRFHRGDPLQPREVITPAGIAAVSPTIALAADALERDRRRALAEWITSDDNPLAARVMMNRLWHYHFGRGLLATPSNFGFHGGMPTHPALLDWLAAEFRAQAGSLKAMHRLMVLSATYRQAATPHSAAQALDATNLLHWRHAPRRLEAEPIRDSILATSGRLDLRMGGPGYDPFEPDDSYVHIYVPKKAFGPAEWRRMIYQLKPRVLQDPTFGEFDCPDASQVAPRRNVSTTALQALNLLNSPFLIGQSRAFAERVRSEAGDDVAAQVCHAFRLAMARDPAGDEIAPASALVEAHGLEALCRAMFNVSEFIYVD